MRASDIHCLLGDHQRKGVGSLFSPARSLPDIAVRDEAKEVWPDARPQARKNRRRIRWNTLRIFSSRERRRCLQIVCRS